MHLSETSRKGAIYALRHLTAHVIGVTPLQQSVTKSQILRWRRKTGDVPIEILTLSALKHFRTVQIRSVGDDHIEKGKCVTTLNSYFRSARSIFTERMMAFYEDFEIPDPLPLRKVPPQRAPSRRYISRIFVAEIVAKAKCRFWDGEVTKEELAEQPASNRCDPDYIREDKARFIILLLTIPYGLSP